MTIWGNGGIMVTDNTFIPASNPLPKQNKVRIPGEKLTKHYLNPEAEPDKAIAFRLALGFTLNYAQLLENKIKAGLKIFSTTEKEANEWGRRYQVIMRITGHNNKTANIVTSWIDDIEKSEMRMTSAYVTKKEVLHDDAGKTV